MDSLVHLYRQMADLGGDFHGLTILQHHKIIAKLVKNTKSRTLLDYGCGRADAYRSPHSFPSVIGVKWSDVYLYDPAFEQYSVKPPGRKFDGVLCSDVCEHIPEDEVPEFVATLFQHARRFVWASVCCRPASKTFPNGITNLHVTVRPIEWWRERFTEASARNLGAIFYLTETP